LKKHFAVFAAVSAISIFLSVGCTCALEEPAPQENAEASSSAGLSVAPDFTLQDLSQGTYTLSSYKGKKPVILFFWTTWCPYCREELKAMKDKYAQLAVDGWEFFAVNVGEGAKKVDGFVKSFSLPFKVLLDKDTSVAKSLGVFGVPTYVFLNKRGEVLAIEHNFSDEQYRSMPRE
jgi:peroxiredoxin